MLFSLCSPACSQQTISWELPETEALSVYHRVIEHSKWEGTQVLLFLHSSAVPIAIFLAYQGMQTLHFPLCHTLSSLNTLNCFSITKNPK